MLYVLVILYMGLPVTNFITGEWSNCLIFHNDIKCIAYSGQMITYVLVQAMSFCATHEINLIYM